MCVYFLHIYVQHTNPEKEANDIVIARDVLFDTTELKLSFDNQELQNIQTQV